MIAIIDYGAGNNKSLQLALSNLSIENKLTRNEALIRESQAIILPGVGAFQDAMNQLKKHKLDKLIQQEAASGKPILGICLGMQLFYEASTEGGISTGLGLMKGRIERINNTVKVPHMGWNTLQILRKDTITKNIPEQAYVYFVHSYYANHLDSNDIIATSQHGEIIPALVKSNNIIGMQFHPEKSGDAGMQLLNNFWGDGFMIIFPAIDLLDGNCVRLVQGDYNQKKMYSQAPLNIVEQWITNGAEALHIVDLNGAKTGKAINRTIIQQIAQQSKVPIQVGGGIRSFDQIEDYLSNGVQRVILGTSAIHDFQLLRCAVDKYGDRIIVSVDSRNGMVATDGWVKDSAIPATVLLQKLEKIGIQTIVYTDIAKDGMLEGPNHQELKMINQATSIQVIASGGVSSLDDVVKLKEMNMYGAIIGKALYDGRIELREVLEVTNDAC